mmetsp:Transcript_43119/g.129479  ORF Transcript_43119/g.129479 Transcript_43119/m.129479 type:complete len:205 (+) Transcript_43119:888-1502(+)
MSQQPAPPWLNRPARPSCPLPRPSLTHAGAATWPRASPRAGRADSRIATARLAPPNAPRPAPRRRLRLLASQHRVLKPASSSAGAVAGRMAADPTTASPLRAASSGRTRRNKAAHLCARFAEAGATSSRRARGPSAALTREREEKRGRERERETAIRRRRWRSAYGDPAARRLLVHSAQMWGMGAAERQCVRVRVCAQQNRCCN